MCRNPADQGPAIVLHPASGVPRPVGLCEGCRSGRPARDSPDLGAADLSWCVLAREAEALLQDYVGGQWLPYEAELHFAGDLARIPWTETSLRAAQQTAPPYGRLHLLLDNACFVLRYTDSHDPALLPLRRLVDVLADDAEHQLPPAADPAPFRETRVQFADLLDDLFVEPMRPSYAHAPEDLYAGTGRHRKPREAGSPSPWMPDLPPEPTTPPAQHRRPRHDDPVPEGVTSLWEWRRHRPRTPHQGPGA